MNRLSGNILLISIDDLADQCGRFLEKSFYLVALLIFLIIVWRLELQEPMLVFAAAGLTILALLPSYLFATRRVYGPPIVPVLCIAELLWFIFPIFSHHHTIQMYSEPALLRAMFSEALFLGPLIFIWYRLTRAWPRKFPKKILLIRPSIQRISEKGQLWLLPLGLATAYLVAEAAWWLPLLYMYMPAGVPTMLRAGAYVTATVSLFFLGISMGAGQLSLFGRLAFFAMFTLSFLAQASGLILNSTVVIVISACAGYSLGSGKLPWRLLIILACIFNVLHYGKAEMRLRYWPSFLGTPRAVSPGDYFEYYQEWARLGWEDFMAPEIPGLQRDSADSLLDRASIVQMLLLAQDRAPSQLPYLGGATLEGLPYQFIPRLFWPQKPRPHEGQALLSVYFGRQDYASTWTTYIAWGLLAEFYANFGYPGCLLLGGAMGLLLGGVSYLAIGMPLGSFRGLVSVLMMLSAFTASQSTAAVYLSSTYQMILVAIGISAVFMRLQSYDPNQVSEDLEDEEEPGLRPAPKPVRWQGRELPS